MLDNETRRRIDSGRDILVGKVPDPKSQVEQITIALIYKFMDDMDKEAIEFGGKASFFTGEYEKYGWSKIFDPRLGGYEMLSLYGEAIEKLDQNPGIPQLFRDIFKNAYLPYRDPETLKLFLKTINEFHYDHSEKLGDAFEYLLSVLGSQGDAGQFRTPRHIIDFIINVLQPKKNETILDPACGTAGFLISSYKYILKQNTNKTQGDLLTPNDRKKIMNQFTGYDISPDMVRLSLVNMYLHHFTSPKIYEYDALTSEDRWGDYFDIIMANPPFMSPKGGIKPHKKFTMQANRSEVLFVDYIAEHINPTTGRAGVIVPEGIIFQSATAYKALRKLLVDKNYLYAVVSLPAGIFNPYSGVKTSVLLMDKTIAKKTDKILFVKIENDGFDLGAQRKAITKNDLTDALEVINNYQLKIKNDEAVEELGDNYLFVDKEKIKANVDYNLSFDRYRINVQLKHANYEIVKLSDVCEINPKKSEVKEIAPDTLVSFAPMADLSENSMDFFPSEQRKISEVFGGYTYFKDNDVLVAKVTPCFENGKAGVSKNLKNGIGFGSSEYYVLRCSEKVLPEFIYLMITTEKFRLEGSARMTGTGGLQRVPKDFICNYQIPLPPIHVQKKLFNNVAYQKIIDGAKQIIENYKPQIDINPEWEMVKLGDVCDKITKGTTPTTNGYKFENEGVFFIKIENIDGEGLIMKDKIHFISVDCHRSLQRSQLKENDILFSIAGTNMGITGLVDISVLPANTNQALAIMRVFDNKILSYKYLFHLLRSNLIQDEIEKIKVGVAQFNLSLQQVSELKIPLPSLSIQQQIVNRIEQEQQLINANKQLVQIFEQKIKDEINKLWQTDTKEYAMGEKGLSLVAEG